MCVCGKKFNLGIICEIRKRKSNLKINTIKIKPVTILKKTEQILLNVTGLLHFTNYAASYSIVKTHK